MNAPYLTETLMPRTPRIQALAFLGGLAAVLAFTPMAWADNKAAAIDEMEGYGEHIK